jgi:quercetin dioxygenase-like cupin family protein
MDYEVLHTEDVPLEDMGDRPDAPIDLSVRRFGEALGLEKLRGALLYFEEGEEIGYHAHAEQEELYYVLDGRFSLKLGRSGDTEVVEVGPGTFFAAGPRVGHGHRCVDEAGGTVLALGAPAVPDPGLDPHGLAEDGVDDGT